MDYYAIGDTDYVISHHGVMGMHWGVRRYQPYGTGYIRKGGAKGKEKISGESTSMERRKSMNYYENNDYRNYLSHHGVMGMHWGVRRYQSYDIGYQRKGGKGGKEISAARKAGSKRPGVVRRLVRKKTLPIKAGFKSFGQKIGDAHKQKGIANKASSLFGYRGSRISAKNTENVKRQLAKEAFTEYGRHKYNVGAKNAKHEQDFSTKMINQKRTAKTVFLGRTMWNKTWRDKKVTMLDGSTITEGKLEVQRRIARDQARQVMQDYDGYPSLYDKQMARYRR